MADIEEAEGNQGAVREWLGRAARAPRDKAWVADGVISDRWAPVSPSGTLDGFVWRTPDERIAAPTEAPALRLRRPRRGDRRARSCAAIAPAPEAIEPEPRSARAGADPRSRAANRRHHRSRIDGARRPGPQEHEAKRRGSGSTPMNEIGRADCPLPRPEERSRRRRVSKDVPERARPRHLRIRPDR